MRRTRKKRGTATVELALCLPLLVLLVFGGLELSNMIYVRQGLVAAAHLAAREIAAPDGQRSDASSIGQEVLDAHGIAGGSIQFSPPNPETAGRTTLISVAVTVPYSRNALFGAPFVAMGDLSATAVFAKESN